MWLELVERYIRLAKSTTISSDLTKLLRIFIEKRSSDEFIDDYASLSTQTPITQTPAYYLFKSDCPDIYEVLRKATNFQNMCSEGEFDRRQGE